MLKMQLLAHSSVKEDIKLLLREAGVVEVTDVSLPEAGEPPAGDRAQLPEDLPEQAEGALLFLDEFVPEPSFWQKLGQGPLETSPAEIERLSARLDVGRIVKECGELQASIRNAQDRLERSRELLSSLEPWKDLGIRLDRMKTEGYRLQLWVHPEKTAALTRQSRSGEYPLCEFMECGRDNGKVYLGVIVPHHQSAALGESLKEAGAYPANFDNLEGTPAEIREREKNRLKELEEELERFRRSAVDLTSIRDQLRILADHYRECRGLVAIEERLHHTRSTFLIEGWVRALDRRKLERELTSSFREIEVSFREPLPSEEPPIQLQNNTLSRPYEFVLTLYGRPGYREVDPTPLLAPFFVLFFALCLTDAGYGLTLAVISGLIMMKFKPAGGAGLLMRVLFMGGLITAVVGVLAGGFFGISPELLPPFLRRFILIDPIQEPMKMLNLSFVMGLVHLLFGMGVRMAANIKAGLYSDAVFDDLLWIIFLIFLAPVGYAAILGGELPPAVGQTCKWAILTTAAVLFVTGGRKQDTILKKILTGLVRFYDIVGYFGDVLSYARLLALGLATSAIALAINDIASMVKDLPFYTGYVVMVLILIGGHLFNLTVNTLGAFVHSGRLQYLEFFSKFFAGGGREFRPFRSERKFSVFKKQ